MYFWQLITAVFTVLLNCRYRDQTKFINWKHFHPLLLFQDLRKGLSWRRSWFCWSWRSPCSWSPPSSSQERWGCVLEAVRLPDHRSWPSRTRLPCLCVLTCKTCTIWTTRILTSSLVTKVSNNHSRSKRLFGLRKCKSVSSLLINFRRYRGDLNLTSWHRSHHQETGVKIWKILELRKLSYVPDVHFRIVTGLGLLIGRVPTWLYLSPCQQLPKYSRGQHGHFQLYFPLQTMNIVFEMIWSY